MDKDAIKDAARGNWKQVLEHAGIPSEFLTTKHGPCPICGGGEGADRFRCFDDIDETGGTVCSTCGVENADGIATIMWFQGVDFKAALSVAGEALGLTEGNKVKFKKKRKPASPLDLVEPCKWVDIFANVFLDKNPGIKISGLELAGAEMVRFEKQTRMGFPTLDASGDTVGYVVMSTSSATLSGKNGKRVRHKQVAGSKSGFIGKHAFNAITNGSKPDGRVVIKCEGLTDMLCCQSAINAHGDKDKQLCLTNASGAGERPKWMAEILAKEDLVVIIHDQDKPGQDGAKRWAHEIKSIREECDVRVLNLPYPMSDTKGMDLRDFIDEKGGDYFINWLNQQLAETKSIEASEDPPPPEEEIEPFDEIFSDLEIDVIGEEEDGSIQIWSQHCRKSSTIRNTRSLSKAQLVQMCGLPAKRAITDDGYSMRDVVGAISLAASTRRFSGRTKPKGIGIYQTKEKHIVLSNGEHLSVWNGSWQRIDTPRCDDLRFRFDGHVWYDHDRMAGLLECAKDRSWCLASINDMADLIGRWTWKDQDLTPPILAGLVISTFVQSIWRWRPSVSIRGETNCGKTSLAKLLWGDTEAPGVFGELACYVAQSSAAGIRQTVGGDSLAICMDEWDSTPLPWRREILGMLRTSGGGERSLRGSSHHDPKAFVMRHISWILGIVAGMDENADKNRFLPFHMLTPPEDRKKAWREPTQEDRDDMAGRMLAIAIAHCQEAALLATRLHATHQGDANLDDRQTANLSVPVAILAASTGQDPDELFCRSAELILDASQDITSDPEEILQKILELEVLAPGSERFTVNYVLFENSTKSFELQPQVMQQLGIEVYQNGDGNEYLSIWPNKISGRLNLESSSIIQLLMNLPGTFRHQHRSPIGKRRFILVPLELCNQPDGG